MLGLCSAELGKGQLHAEGARGCSGAFSSHLVSVGWYFMSGEAGSSIMDCSRLGGKGAWLVLQQWS